MKILNTILCLAASVALASCSAQEPTVRPIQDNASPRMMARALFDAPDEIIEELGLEEGVPSSVCAFLVETGKGDILFDTGNGAPDSQLLPSISQMQKSPSDIECIFITHLHGDHIGGLLVPGTRNAAFSQADIYINKVEYDAWMAMPEEQTARLREIMKAYEGRVKTFDASEELPFGVVAIPAYGHTPGHTMFKVGSNLIAGDIMHGVALQTVHPDVCARFDMDKQNAADARKKALETVRKENLRMYGMHFPDPYYL